MALGEAKGRGFGRIVSSSCTIRQRPSRRDPKRNRYSERFWFPMGRTTGTTGCRCRLKRGEAGFSAQPLRAVSIPLQRWFGKFCRSWPSEPSSSRGPGRGANLRGRFQWASDLTRGLRAWQLQPVVPDVSVLTERQSAFLPGWLRSVTRNLAHNSHPGLPKTPAQPHNRGFRLTPSQLASDDA